ncbi:Ribosome biogenesis protein BRX1 protein [Dioscorea alata]|uniref:Ribosome biogenesis protein BRX1 protein n=1 Tax=Dioscorea alata TaxID=55571 RepID=A0ACB7VJ15_DIOAL|nr:Ribosome biogenesis protein BRX1 protein [Dioscorea alata]
MGKKRKQAEAQEVVKKDDTAPPRPKRTLLGWKDGAVVKKSDSPVFRNKEKVLVTCSRRINSRYRHLMMDVVSLLPHCKKDSKVESKETKGATLNEIVELRNCSSILFFECRKQKDLYLWMAKSPGGPSAKFLVNAVHTMEELKLTGNHLKGSRPILTFSSNFDEEPHWKLLKELIMQISVPHNEIDKVDRGGLDKMTLVEVGPRFCLNPIKIFGGQFWWSNLV